MFRALLAHPQEALLCAVVDVGWSQDVGRLFPHLQPHTSHQSCICVVPPEDGQVMFKTCRDFEPQYSVSESEVCIKLVVLITKLRHYDTRSTKHYILHCFQSSAWSH
jgi:hypothetical protein